MDKKILVVDDEDIIRSSCKRILAPAGFQVSTASDGIEALGMIKKSLYDVVILDMKMPNMDGIEFLENVKNIPSAPKIIIITGYSTIETASEAQKLGAWGYIEKPFNPARLLFAVNDSIK